MTLKDKRTGFEAGTLFIKINYKSIDEKLLSPNWSDKLVGPKQLDNKYEFFNDNLANEFKDDCQFGSLTLELDSLSIPAMQDSRADG